MIFTGSQKSMLSLKFKKLYLLPITMTVRMVLIFLKSLVQDRIQTHENAETAPFNVFLHKTFSSHLFSISIPSLLTFASPFFSRLFQF